MFISYGVFKNNIKLYEINVNNIHIFHFTNILDIYFKHMDY